MNFSSLLITLKASDEAKRTPRIAFKTYNATKVLYDRLSPRCTGASFASQNAQLYIPRFWILLCL